MNFIKNSHIVQQACSQFVQSHPCLYNFHAEILPFITPYPQLSILQQDVSSTLTIGQQTIANLIKLHLIKNTKNSDNCIIYMHGLSSYCLEGKFLLPFLGESFSLALYDSRAHGLNKSKFVTYGLLESQDLAEIIKTLKQKGFKNIILWGRSMGAVTALRLIQQENISLLQSVKYVVADAPFSSFNQIATDIVSKITNLPDFLSGVLAGQFAQKIKEKHGIDLSLIDLQNLRSEVPVNFLFSSNDELMGEKHIKSIVENFKGDYEVNDILVKHNDERPAWVIAKLMANIRQKVKHKVLNTCQTKRRGLSITKYYEERLTFSRTPTPFSEYDTRNFDHVKTSSKINVSCHRQAKYHPAKLLKENLPNLRNFKGSQVDFRGELGGNKVDLVSHRFIPTNKRRHITARQFFDEEA